MAQFRIVHAPKFSDISHVISDKYFVVDTAGRNTVDGWIKKNPHYLTYAYDGDKHIGFVGILPLTMECGQMLDKGELLEEDLTADLVLLPESMQHTQYLYITAIAVDDVTRYQDKQAAAALVSCAAGMIRNLYGNGQLKKIFANPTTYWGNRIIGRFGLRPSTSYKKLLKAGNDVYEVTVTPEHMAYLAGLELKYQRFIANYPWPLPDN